MVVLQHMIAMIQRLCCLVNRNSRRDSRVRSVPVKKDQEEDEAVVVVVETEAATVTGWF